MNLFMERHFRENYSRLVKVVLRRLGNNKALAEEAVSEAYTRAMQYYHSFNEDYERFDGWFISILNNAVRDKRKEEIGRGVFKEEDIDEIDVGMIHNAANSELTKLVDKELSLVSNITHRQVNTLYFKNNLTAKNIREIMEGLSLNSIQQIVSRFRNSFVKKYQVDGTLLTDNI